MYVCVCRKMLLVTWGQVRAWCLSCLVMWLFERMAFRTQCRLGNAAPKATACICAPPQCFSLDQTSTERSSRGSGCNSLEQGKQKCPVRCWKWHLYHPKVGTVCAVNKAFQAKMSVFIALTLTTYSSLFIFLSLLIPILFLCSRIATKMQQVIVLNLTATVMDNYIVTTWKITDAELLGTNVRSSELLLEVVATHRFCYKHSAAIVRRSFSYRMTLAPTSLLVLA